MLRRIVRFFKESYRYLAFDFSQFRGIYETFEQAKAKAPAGKRVGYDNSELAREYRTQLNVRLSSFDFPVLFYLNRVLKAGDTVLDYGGNIGVHFLRFKKYLNLDKVWWIVCDLPEITKVGAETCAGVANIKFINDIVAANGQDVDIFLACGSIQYVHSPELLLKTLIGKKVGPKHILIDQLPLYEGPTFVTLQNGGLVCYPQYVFNRKEFVNAIEELGYKLIDMWDDVTDSCIIPFHPEKSIQAYKGLYFSKTQEGDTAC